MYFGYTTEVEENINKLDDFIKQRYHNKTQAQKRIRNGLNLRSRTNSYLGPDKHNKTIYDSNIKFDKQGLPDQEKSDF